MKRLAFLLLPLALSGCETRTWRSDEPPVERPVVWVPDRQKEFSDVPVPMDFERSRDSYAFERGRFRICRLVYEGALDPFRTEDFMRRQMELSGWTPTDRSLDEGEKILCFSKGNERCRIGVRRDARERHTRMTVTIEPA